MWHTLPLPAFQSSEFDLLGVCSVVRRQRVGVSSLLPHMDALPTEPLLLTWLFRALSGNRGLTENLLPKTPRPRKGINQLMPRSLLTVGA